MDIDHTVYLAQTDTIIGFVSQDRERLDRIKGRDADKQYITALPSLKALRRLSRIPASHRNLIRRSRRTTFILPNGSSYRVIKDKHHVKLIKNLGWAFTTSANRSDKSYDEQWARSVADETIEPLRSVSKSPSAIYKIGRNSLMKLR